MFLCNRLVGPRESVGLLILVHFASPAVLYNSYREFRKMIFCVYCTAGQVSDMILLRQSFLETCGRPLLLCSNRCRSNSAFPKSALYDWNGGRRTELLCLRNTSAFMKCWILYRQSNNNKKKCIRYTTLCSVSHGAWRQETHCHYGMRSTHF